MERNLQHVGCALWLSLWAAALPAVGQGDYSATVLSQQPIAYYRLSEQQQPAPFLPLAVNEGNLGPDSDGQLIFETLLGEPGAVEGNASYRFLNPGWDITFVGSRVDVPYADALNPNGPFTVEFWARPTEGGRDLFSPLSAIDTEASGGEARAGYIFYYDGENRRWDFRVGNLSGYQGLVTGGTAPAGAWRHVVGVFTGNSISLYVNGGLAATSAVTSFSPNRVQPLRIGGTTVPNRGFNGWIDEVAFYGSALSGDAIRSHYLAATNGAQYATRVGESSPLGYWRLGERGDHATNAGTLGALANGRYNWGVQPGVFGPRSPGYPGFETTNSAFLFDGVEGHATLPPLDLSTNGITFSGWVNAGLEQFQGAGLIVSRDGDTDAGITLGTGLNPLELGYFWNGNPIGSSWGTGFVLPENIWTYVALVVEPARAIFYVGDQTTAGFLSYTNPVPHGFQSFNGLTWLGSDPAISARTFNGSLDEVAVFDRALSIGEIYSQFGAAVGNLPAIIYSEPQPSSLQIQEGNLFTIEVDAGGSPDLLFQWYRNGTPLPGANSHRLSKVATLEDQASFHVTVGNHLATITSQPAQVSVVPLGFPFILSPPAGRTVFPGGRLELQVTATGGGLEYQWVKDGGNLPNATNSTFVIPFMTTNHAGQYLVRIANSYGEVGSSAAQVEVVVPAANSYEAAIIDDQPFCWWRLNDPPLSKVMTDSMGRFSGFYSNTTSAVTFRSEGIVRDGAIASDGTVPFFGVVPYHESLGTAAFTFECWARLASAETDYSPLSFYNASKRGHFIYADAETGRWRMGVGAGEDPSLFYYLGDIPGARIATNRWTHLVMTSDGVSVRWYVNGESSDVYDNFPRNVTAPLLIGGVGGEMKYPFHGVIDEVLFYQKALPPSSVRAHFLAAAYPVGVGPAFVEQPVPATAIVGDSARFAARVEGTPPFTFRWFKDGQLLGTQTGSELVLNAVAFEDFGVYQLQAVNSLGTNFSNPARLSVYPFPTFVNATNDLVLHLPFDGDLKDTSPLSHDASPVNSPAFISGRVGSHALRVTTDATASIYRYASLGLIDDFRFSSNQDFTVTYWVRLPAGATPGDLPFLGTALNSFGFPGITFGPSYREGGWAYSLNGIVQGIGSAGSLNDGQWHHLLHSFDRDGEGVTFLNGVQVDSRAVTLAGDLDVPNAFTIGQDPSGNYPETATFDLDDIGLWRRALSAEEAKAVYYAGRGGNSFDTFGPVVLRWYKSGERWMLVWQAGTLLQSDNLEGPWTPVPDSIAPNYWLPPNGPGRKFYRVVL